MAESLPQSVERELAELAERLTAPGQTECLRCYLLRMTEEFGCDGTYRWTIRWRDVRAASPRGVLRQMERKMSFCDCEILANVFPGYPQSPVRLPCAGIPRPGSTNPCDLRNLRKSA